MKAYAGDDLDGNLLRAVSYSLQKAFVKFGTLEVSVTWKDSENVSNPAVNYFWKIPFRFLTTGRFFTTLFVFPVVSSGYDIPNAYAVIRFVIFFYMPYISKDYGISGDEFVDHRHSGYVLDFFTKGDKAALNQPQTALHLYGNSSRWWRLSWLT